MRWQIRMITAVADAGVTISRLKILMQIDFRSIVGLAKQAGHKIMAIYAQDFAVYDKPDQSPLTDADLAAHQCIVQGLAQLTPDIPVLSEESDAISSAQRLSWSRYWLMAILPLISR